MERVWHFNISIYQRVGNIYTITNRYPELCRVTLWVPRGSAPLAVVMNGSCLGKDRKHVHLLKVQCTLPVEFDSRICTNGFISNWVG